MFVSVIVYISLSVFVYGSVTVFVPGFMFCLSLRLCLYVCVFNVYVFGYVVECGVVCDWLLA